MIATLAALYTYSCLVNVRFRDDHLPVDDLDGDGFSDVEVSLFLIV